MKRAVMNCIVVGVLFVLASGFFLYPEASKYVNDKKYAAENSQYYEEIKQLKHNDPQKVEDKLHDASMYNLHLAKYYDKHGWKLVDPWSGVGAGSDVLYPQRGRQDSGSSGENNTQGQQEQGETSGQQNPNDPLSSSSRRPQGTSSQQGHRGRGINNNQGTLRGNGQAYRENGAPNTISQQSERLNVQDYEETLAEGKQIGTLVIPSIHVNLPIFHGLDDEVLFKGIGHMFGTSLPVGGKGTHAGLAGHSGVKNLKMLDDLEKVKVGNVFYVETLGKVLKYRVTSTEVVLPYEIEKLAPQKDNDLVTIITCVPYAVNTHRLLVTGEREDDDIVDVSAASNIVRLGSQDEDVKTTELTDPSLDQLQEVADKSTAPFPNKLLAMILIVLGIGILLFSYLGHQVSSQRRRR